MSSTSETPKEYRSYSIQKDQRNPYGSVEFMYYPTEQGIQHDADYDGEQYKYTGNCAWASTIEEAKSEIDERIAEQESKTNTLKHTPAPWSIDKDSWWHIDNPFTQGYIPIRSVQHPWLAEVKGKHVNDDLTKEEMIANAKLIAMAPELLSSCMALVEEMVSDSPELSSYKQDVIRRARSVIKQATE